MLWGHFLVSTQLIVCASPVLLFSALVGWQPTHLAVVLGALSLVPAWPAVFAALSTMRQVVAERDAHIRCARVFWKEFARGVRLIGTWVAAATLAVLVLGYDLALAPGAVALPAVVVGASALAALTVGLCSVKIVSPGRHTLPALADVVALTCPRPHLGLVWLLAAVAPVGLLLVPVAGAMLALFAPAAAASVVAIVNGVFGFDRKVLERAERR
jgi:hypothetical protein